jgi:two-component system sensor histidine kinase MtrB
LRTRQRSGFRRRLTTTFVVVIALSTAIVAVVTVLVARELRLRNFRADSISQARFTIVVAPPQLDDATFERLAAGYEARDDADLLAIQAGRVYASRRNLTIDDIPAAVLTVSPDSLQTTHATVDGRDMFVVGAQDDEGITFFFFFSQEETSASIGELARVAAGAWVVVLIAASAVSWRVTRRTLRPVADVASTAEAIASGDLGARLPADVGDEFGALTTSFNHMADEVELMVDRLESAAARERQFTADVAHELRTPLTGMTATASILRMQLDQLPTRLQRPATVLVTDVERMRDLVLDLLELARLDSGNEPPRVEPLRVLDAVRSVLVSSEVEGIVQVIVNPTMAVLADPTRLRRILSNLIRNAVVHGDPPIEITARTVVAPDGSDAVAIDIVDHGPGIDDLDHVFDRFYKSEKSRAAGGSGLGLAISRQYARSQSGDVTAENVDGAGARLTLRLPVA